jgi:hypothetical protein
MKKREKTGRTYQISTPAVYQWTRTCQNLNISLCLAFFLPSWPQNIRGVWYPAARDGLWRKTVQGNQAAKLAISPLHLVNITLQFKTKDRILLGEYLCNFLFFYHDMDVWCLFWLDCIDNRRHNLCFGPKNLESSTSGASCHYSKFIFCNTQHVWNSRIFSSHRMGMLFPSLHPLVICCIDRETFGGKHKYFHEIGGYPNDCMLRITLKLGM